MHCCEVIIAISTYALPSFAGPGKGYNVVYLYLHVYLNVSVSNILFEHPNMKKNLSVLTNIVPCPTTCYFILCCSKLPVLRNYLHI